VRTLRQIEADAWIAADRPAEAVAPLADAVRRVHADLARATSRAGRLELGWRVRDSAALLAWCHARAGDAQRACEALETGRGLLWSGGAADGAAAWSGDWSRLVPPGGAVAVPTFAGATGMAVVATRGADGAALLDVVALPKAGAAALRALVSGAEPEVRLGGWLEAWCHRTSAPERFDAAVAHAAAELHRRVAAPVVACLDARGIAVGAELVWVPQGASSVLPLQAAAPAAGGPGLLDRVALRFAPSLAALERIARAESVGAAAAGPPLAVVDPTGDLPFAPLEALWLAEAEPALEVLRGEDATVARVLERLAPPPALLHVAGHGAFDLDDPFASALLLAGGARLTLDALLPRLAARGAPALVVLSACETSVVRATAHADELLGFPAALLAHGVRGAVGSLWPVADAQTALLMRVFHARRRAEGGAAALRAAQRWLRDARRSDVVAVLAPLRDRPAPIGPLVAAALAELAAADDGAPPFAHPVHWAGFALWGRA
jgi:CHAT domain-containing protein